MNNLGSYVVEIYNFVYWDKWLVVLWEMVSQLAENKTKQNKKSYSKMKK